MPSKAPEDYFQVLSSKNSLQVKENSLAAVFYIFFPTALSLRYAALQRVALFSGALCCHHSVDQLLWSILVATLLQ